MTFLRKNQQIIISNNRELEQFSVFEVLNDDLQSPWFTGYGGILTCWMIIELDAGMFVLYWLSVYKGQKFQTFSKVFIIHIFITIFEFSLRNALQ